MFKKLIQQREKDDEQPNQLTDREATTAETLDIFISSNMQISMTEEEI